jgi:hypothetical protein
MLVNFTQETNLSAYFGPIDARLGSEARLATLETGCHGNENRGYALSMKTSAPQSLTSCSLLP